MCTHSLSEHARDYSPPAHPQRPLAHPDSRTNALPDSEPHLQAPAADASKGKGAVPPKGTPAAGLNANAPPPPDARRLLLRYVALLRARGSVRLDAEAEETALELMHNALLAGCTQYAEGCTLSPLPAPSDMTADALGLVAGSLAVQWYSAQVRTRQPSRQPGGLCPAPQPRRQRQQRSRPPPRNHRARAWLLRSGHARKLTPRAHPPPRRPQPTGGAQLELICVLTNADGQASLVRRTLMHATVRSLHSRLGALRHALAEHRACAGPGGTAGAGAAPPALVGVPLAELGEESSAAFLELVREAEELLLPGGGGSARELDESARPEALGEVLALLERVFDPEHGALDTHAPVASWLHACLVEPVEGAPPVGSAANVDNAAPPPQAKPKKSPSKKSPR
ncbi:hypothetical protein T492DRAFT_500545 [Pavlovales sp. CCMP2436]|nr:hypothetical protein T492DRAFT_500545 [Pavlovales sp. CCMP2436]